MNDLSRSPWPGGIFRAYSTGANNRAHESQNL